MDGWRVIFLAISVVGIIGIAFAAKFMPPGIQIRD